MPATPQTPCALPFPLTRDPVLRPSLVMLRRMARHGLRDAGASWAAIDTFGTGFRKPLALLRCFTHELALASKRRIAIGPCCARRMTRDEALMLEAIELGCIAALQELTGSDAPDRVMSVAVALRAELQAHSLRRR